MSPPRRPRAATPTQWREAAADLARRDRVLARLHADHGPPRLRRALRASRRFEALARAIAYQQLNGVAAGTIWGRVRDVVGEPFDADSVLRTDPDALRAAGLSGAKTAALTDLASKCATGEVRLGRIGALDDHDVIEHLVVVRGIGRWTAQMFLMSDLRRLDVWPTGDYGVRAGFARAYGLTEMPTERELAALGEPFAPYRSVVAWWCWREMDTATP